MNKFKKILAFLLAACLMVSGLGVMPVQAAEDEGWVDVYLDSEYIDYDDAWTIEMLASQGGIDSAFCYTKGAKATLTFYGTGIRWYGQKDTNFGDAIVKIDGVEVADVNVNGAMQTHVLHYENTELEAGAHTISIEPKTGGTSVEAGVVDIERFQVYNEVKTEWTPIYLDSEYIDYADAWTIEMLASQGGIDSAYCYDQGAAATLTFYGTGVRWYGQKDINFGEAIVKIDGVEVATVDVYGTAQTSVLHYENTNLEEGTHTISIEPKNQGTFPDSGCIDIEKFEVLSSTVMIPVTAIRMNADSESIYVGDTAQITAAVDPFNASVQTVTYTSSDETIATVDENGLVTGLKAGTVTITGTVVGSTATDSVTITVKESGQKAPLRMTIDNENPLFLHHLYLNKNQVNNNLPGPLEGGKSIQGFWDALVNGDANGNELSEELKDRQVLIIHAGGNVQGNADTLAWYEARFEETVEDQIPFVIMVSNSGTGNSNSIGSWGYYPPSVDWVSEMYDTYPNMMGVIFSENHNATNGRDARSVYMNDMVLLAAEKGGYVFYSDMNDNGDYVETVLDDQTLFNTLKANKDNFVLLAKTTSAWSNVSYNSHESVAMGAWMADIAGNWGSLIDSWMWFIEGFGPLWGDDTFSVIGGAEECRGPVTFPELLFEMRMIQEARVGATVFTFEHPDYSTGIGKDQGQNIYFTPAFTESIMKAMEYMTEYEIPTKDEVLDTVKVTYAAENGTLNDLAGTGINLLNPLYGDTNHNGYNGTTMMTYSTGRYGTVPSLPELATAADKAQFDHVLTKNDVSAMGGTSAIKAYFDNLYPETYEGTGYAHFLNNTWYAYNSNWNIDSRVETELHEDQYVDLELTNNDKSVNITFDPYTTVLVDDQKLGEIKVKFNNYLVDKNEIWDGYNVNSTQHWDSDNNQLMYNWIMSSYIPDAETNDDTYRQATIVLEGLSAEPTLTVVKELVNADDSKQADAPETAWDAAAGTYTIELSGNGWMEFTIALDDADTPEPPAVDYSELNAAIREAKSKNEEDYTAESWAALDEVLSRAMVINENDPTQDEVDDLTEELLQAIADLEEKGEEPPQPPVEDNDEVVRISGKDRYATGYAAAEALKAALGVDKFDAVVVATGKNFADALSGSYLAIVKEAPILLTNGKDDNVAELHAYIKENVNANGTVYILGGSAAVPATVEAIEGYTVKRLAGASRYDTNLEILAEAGITGTELIVATGKEFADSLSASATGRPILLVKPGAALSAEQKAIAETVKGGNIYVVGGTGAVAETTAAELESYAAVERIAGSGRQETSKKIAEKFFADAKAVVVANAKNFPDGLCGGPLAAAMNAPLLLTATGNTAIAEGYVQGNALTSGVVLGGTGALSDEAVVDVFGVMAKTYAEESVFELAEDEVIYVENQIFTEDVTISGDNAQIVFTNCKFLGNVVNTANVGTRVLILESVVYGNCVFDNDVKEATMETSLPKFITDASVNVIGEECVGNTIVLNDSPITLNGNNYAITDADLFADLTDPDWEYVEYTGQEATVYWVAQWWENGETVILVGAEYEPVS